MTQDTQMMGFADFINYLMEKYELEKNSSKKAIRAKITYTLKSKPKYIKDNIWTKAPSQNINGHNQKMFDTAFLKDLEIQISPYLNKLSNKEGNLTPQEIELRAKKQAKEYERWEEEWQNEQLKHAQDPYYNEYKDYGKPESGEALEKSLDRLMLRAIFNKFFTMSEKQRQQFAEDNKYKYMLTEDFIGSNEYAKASYRLSKPEKYYYDERK